MSKNSLYLIVAIALAATAGTFFLTRNGPTVVCDSLIANTPELSVAQLEQPPSIKIVMRGYPLSYYQEPLPANCISTASANAYKSGFSTVHLAYDLLIWLGVAILLFLPSALLRWWRGPAMLGDKMRRA